jgi:hypothetical protein
LEFLFNGLVFLNTSLGFSIPLNLGECVEEGLSNVNTGVFSVPTLCFDNPRRFFFINNESAERGFNSVSLVIKKVCGKGFG